MPIAPGDLLRDTLPSPVAESSGRYLAQLPDAWRIFYAFGGATMAIALRAATREVDRDDLELISTEATFCAAIPCGPVAAQVEVLRQGRAAAQALVRVWALDPDDPDPTGRVRSDLVVTVVFGTRTASPFDFVGAMPPDVPGPLECPERELDPESPFAAIPYHGQTDFRPTGPSAEWGAEFPPGEPRTSSWFRFRIPPLDASGRWEPASLALPGDMLGTAVHAGAGSAGGTFLVISLQIGLHFVADARTEWLLQHTRAHVAGDGYASGSAELWDEERNLVAVATQCAMVRPFSGDGTS